MNVQTPDPRPRHPGGHSQLRRLLRRHHRPVNGCGHLPGHAGGVMIARPWGQSPGSRLHHDALPPSSSSAPSGWLPRGRRHLRGAEIVLSALDFPVALAGLSSPSSPHRHGPHRPQRLRLHHGWHPHQPADGTDRHGRLQRRCRGKAWTWKSPRSDRASSSDLYMRRRGEASRRDLEVKLCDIAIIGGEAAGMSAAAKGAPSEPGTPRLWCYEASEVISFGACGLPYFVGDDFQEPGYMAEFTPSSSLPRDER